MNKSFTTLLIIPLAILFGCSGSTSGTSEKKEDTYRIDSVNLLQTLNDLKDEYQRFVINPLRDTMIVGQNGTKIHYKKDILQFEDGSQPVDPIVLRLLELKNQADFARNNVQTISNEEKLESGGIYFIDFVLDGQKLFLNPSDSLLVQFPKQTDKDMLLFYGARNSEGPDNWTSDSVELKPEVLMEIICFDIPIPFHEVYHTVGDIKYDEYGREIKEVYCDTIYIQDVNPDSVKYEIIGLSELGWIGCHRFVDSSRTTDLEIQIKNKNVRCANVYLLYKQYNSVLINRVQYVNKSYNIFFCDVVPDEEIILAAIAHSNGKILSYQTDTILVKGMKISLDFNETSITF